MAVVHVVAIFAQPVFAGRLLIGDYDMIVLHRLGADLVSYLGLARLVLPNRPASQRAAGPDRGAPARRAHPA